MLTYIITVLIALLLAFLCGSIPVAIIVGKSMRGLDVREHGSGNAGSTNAIRVLGLGPGLLVFAGDVLKGALGGVIVALAVGISVALASMAASQEAITMALSDVSSGALEYDPLLTILASDNSSFLFDVPRALAIIATVLGHMFSPFMSFKGGKGVATALGSVSVVLPYVALCSLAVFAIIVLITRYVSLGSVVAVITVPLFTALFPFLLPDLFDFSPTFVVFTTILAIAVVWAHRKNIARLTKGEEPQFSLPKKDKGNESAKKDSL